MSKRKVGFAILFILGVSLLNVAVLIDASNQENQLAVDAFEQQPLPMESNYYAKRGCDSSKRCSIIDRHSSCTEYNGYCD